MVTRVHLGYDPWASPGPTSSSSGNTLLWVSGRFGLLVFCGTTGMLVGVTTPVDASSGCLICCPRRVPWYGYPGTGTLARVPALTAAVPSYL